MDRQIGMRRWLAFAAVLLAVLSLLVRPALAGEEETGDPVAASTAVSAPDMSRTCTLSIKTSQSGTFKVWKVADSAYNGSGMLYFTLTDQVAQTGVNIDLTKLSGSYSEDAASTLSNTLNAQTAIKPVTSVHLDANENAVSIGSFAPGLYLVDCIADPTGDVEMSPVLVSLPTIVDHQWVYDVSMDAVKFSFSVEMTHFRVLKIWNDNDNAKGDRPKYCTIQIVNKQTGDSEEVRLEDDNDWTYEWDSDEGMLSSDWAVTELNVDGNYTFSVQYTRDNDFGVFSVTNTHGGQQGEHKDTESETGGTHRTPSETPGGQNGTVRTGDTNPITSLVVLLVVSAAVIVALVVGRRRKKG